MNKMQRMALGVMLALIASSAAAETATSLVDREEQLRKRFAAVQQRLELTDEQAKQVAPILEEVMRSRQALFDGLGIEPEGETKPRLGIRDARSFRKQLKRLDAEMLSRLESVLTEDQLEELRQILEERRAQLRERMRAGAR